MDQTEFQQVILQKLEKDCPNSNITYLGDYDGQLAFSIKLRTKPGVRFVVTGYPVYALVEPGDFERYRLVSNLDFKITDHFFPPEQNSSSDDGISVYDLTIKF